MRTTETFTNSLSQFTSLPVRANSFTVDLSKINPDSAGNRVINQYEPLFRMNNGKVRPNPRTKLTSEALSNIATPEALQVESTKNLVVGDEIVVIPPSLSFYFYYGWSSGDTANIVFSGQTKTFVNSADNVVNVASSFADQLNNDPLFNDKLVATAKLGEQMMTVYSKDYETIFQVVEAVTSGSGQISLRSGSVFIPYKPLGEIASISGNQINLTALIPNFSWGASGTPIGTRDEPVGISTLERTYDSLEAQDIIAGALEFSMQDSHQINFDGDVKRLLSIDEV